MSLNGDSKDKWDRCETLKWSKYFDVWMKQFDFSALQQSNKTTVLENGLSQLRTWYQVTTGTQNYPTSKNVKKNHFQKNSCKSVDNEVFKFVPQSVVHWLIEYMQDCLWNIWLGLQSIYLALMPLSQDGSSVFICISQVTLWNNLPFYTILCTLVCACITYTYFNLIN